MEQNSNNIPELQFPFEQLREIDADGKEWWNSRKLARVMGYGKYWNFERVIAKAQAWTMADWSALLQRYMDLNNRPLLPDAGRVTHEQAVEKALTEYDKFRIIQDREMMSDFDKQLKMLFGENKKD